MCLFCPVEKVDFKDLPEFSLFQVGIDVYIKTGDSPAQFINILTREPFTIFSADAAFHGAPVSLLKYTLSKDAVFNLTQLLLDSIFTTSLNKVHITVTNYNYSFLDITYAIDIIKQNTRFNYIVYETLIENNAEKLKFTFEVCEHKSKVYIDENLGFLCTNCKTFNLCSSL